MEFKFSYKEISNAILQPERELVQLNKKTIIGHMVDDLPQTPWIDTGISEWLPDDDNLPVEYSSYESPFGKVLIANTPRGVCYLGVVNGQICDVLEDFFKRFGYAAPKQMKTRQQKTALDHLQGKMNEHLQFHLKGSHYQTEMWRRLLQIPFGKVISYANLAGKKEYARAAGTANGRNPIFYLVPCHRVVSINGKFDRYLWGKEIKKRLLAWEFANSIQTLD